MIFKLCGFQMDKIKTLRISLIAMIIAFAVILLVTISPISNSLQAAKSPTSLLSGSVSKTSSSKYETAIFAMGCFWCAESDFEKVPGVTNVVSGYTGGNTKSPSYDDVITETTGHYEAIRVTYDPKKVRYGELLKIFWANVDPFDSKGQFCDKGTSYRAAIFPINTKQRAAAKASRDYLVKFFKRDLATQIVPSSKFYLAEGYHQDYYKKNPLRYKLYRKNCGRDNRLKAIWGAK